MWYRVFGVTDPEIQPAELVAHLQQQGMEVQAHFRGDEQGWLAVELVYEDLVLTLNKFLVSEEGIRWELNSWAGWIEEQANPPVRDYLMQKIISVQQLFVMELPDEAKVEEVLGKLCDTLCHYLAARTNGFFQVDNQGFYNSDGTLLIKE